MRAVVVEGGGLDSFLVEIESGKWHTGGYSYEESRAAACPAPEGALGRIRDRAVDAPGKDLGRTAPTYPSSKLNRVDRRGGHVRQRAQSPYTSAGPEVFGPALPCWLWCFAPRPKPGEPQ